MKALKDSPKCSVHFKSYGRNEKCLLPSKQCFSPQFSFGTLCLMTPFFLHKSSGNKFDDAKIFLQKLAVISLMTPSPPSPNVMTITSKWSLLFVHHFKVMSEIVIITGWLRGHYGLITRHYRRKWSSLVLLPPITWQVMVLGDDQQSNDYVDSKKVEK